MGQLDNQIVIVSGLPRSGTSLMMQMLEAGGLPIVADGVRTADEDNPKGYFELERIKNLRNDNAWIADARGKACKVISHLLMNLPTGEDYRVIFVQRDLDEVAASQEAMLMRNGKPALPRDRARGMFENHLKSIDTWMQQQPGITVLYVSHRALVEQPAEQCRRVQEFLGIDMPVDVMAAVVDEKLYRNRSN